MNKIDLGHVKESKRVRQGMEQILKRYNKKQREIIVNSVKNKPDDMTIVDVLNIYGVSSVVYYSWLKNKKIDICTNKINRFEYWSNSTE